MEVLSFQIGIFIIIFLVGAFGTKARFYVCVIIGIFTLFAVFMTWLAILQLFTIWISYQISDNLSDPNSEDGSYNFAGCLKTIFTIVFSIIIISLLMETCDSCNDKKTKQTVSKTDSVDNTIHSIDNSNFSPQNYQHTDTMSNSELEEEIEPIESSSDYEPKYVDSTQNNYIDEYDRDYD